ncbi:hypothetical protein ACVRY7_08830 [Streptococcus ictaluri]|uniref:Niacin transporter NiaX n=1 Tax=Streptococcus ictaluri 707-05 TaxID=764299 RepID=G5K5V6_9STRE|nr:hypothetical protein [Streptococcus ictaluri]EHI68643.1 hypothetical protein STRIC_0443 [Streptococcus ictaluri 707-05]
MSKKPTQMIAYSSILVAFAILIPMFMPIKLILGPASFTLASHVPLFLATFISLPVAILVAIGTTLGFFLAGFPFVIVCRAFSHLIFAAFAAWLLERRPSILLKKEQTFVFALMINIVHGLAEFITVYVMTATDLTNLSYFWTMLGLVGFGSLVHGMVDFYLALSLWRFLSQKIGLPLAKLKV